jgi:SAM-dependent methyltransferase
MKSFDQIGSAYDEARADRTAQRAAGAWLAEHLPAGARVLDLGCGSGEPTSRELSERGFDVVGLDESRVMLDLARRNAPKAAFVTGDIRRVPADLGQFDAIAAFFVLVMLSRAEIPGVLADLRSRLRGPKLLAIGMVDGDLDAVTVNYLGVEFPVTAYPVDDLAKIVTDAGFTVEQRVQHAAGAEGETHIYLYARG